MDRSKKWFDLFQTAAVLFGLLATVHTIREDTWSRKVQNTMALTTSHRELWSMMLQNPKLRRVLNPKADIKRRPPTEDEELFVQMMILHLRAALKARETKLEFDDEDIITDVREIFALPVPNAVWQKTKNLHDEDLKALVGPGLAQGSTARKNRPRNTA